MKIKKWKELLTGIALVGTITPIVSLSVNKNNTTQATTSLSVLKNTSSKTTVDYSLVEKMMSEVSLKSLNNQNDIELTPEQEQKVQELEGHYLGLFKSNNYSLEEIQSYMCENFPQYKEEYEKQVKALKLNRIHNIANTLTANLNKNALKETSNIEEQINSLNFQRGVIIAATTVFSVAVAGYWAATFWTFGATAAAATACTSSAVSCGILQDNLNHLINDLNEYKIKYVDIDWKNIHKSIILETLKACGTVMICQGTRIHLSCWCCPAAVGVGIAIEVIGLAIDITMILIDKYY